MSHKRLEEQGKKLTETCCEKTAIDGEAWLSESSY
jgi:hypothetical protein